MPVRASMRASRSDEELEQMQVRVPTASIAASAPSTALTSLSSRSSTIFSALSISDAWNGVPVSDSMRSRMSWKFRPA